MADAILPAFQQDDDITSRFMHEVQEREALKQFFRESGYTEGVIEAMIDHFRIEGLNTPAMKNTVAVERKQKIKRRFQAQKAWQMTKQVIGAILTFLVIAGCVCTYFLSPLIGG